MAKKSLNLRSQFLSLNVAGRSPREEFKRDRIPGSQFFDVDKISDPDTDLPHMLPTEQAFAAAADVLGIHKDTQVGHCTCPHASKAGGFTL